MNKVRRMCSILIVVALISIAGCMNDAKDNSEFDLTGTWTENVGWNSSVTTHTFSFDFWKQSNTKSAYLNKTIISIDNVSDYFIYRENDQDQFNPGKYGKVYWIESSSGMAYYCMIAYGKNSAEEAVNADISSLNASDPENGGCGGFSWSKIQRAD